MEFRILGPLEAGTAGESMSLGGPKQRALFAVLLLHEGEALSRDRLVEQVWGAEAPASAEKIVQIYVSRLRKALAALVPGRQVVVTSGAGYVVRLEPGELDARRFERLFAEGRRALAEGEFAAAAATLQEAIGLWRGPALADFRSEPFAQAEIARLEELRLGAIEDRLEAELALGHHTELVAELEGLIASHPMRERLRRQLMLALYRAGRQVDALEEFQRARRVLVRELGIEPSVSLKTLQAAILRQDASLDPETPETDGGAAIRPERKTITALVAAFAPSEEQLDPEAGDSATAQLADEARQIVSRHGGLVLELSGDHVLAVFGLPRSHEDDALRAMRSAIELRERTALSRDVGLGIGIGTGPVLVRPSVARRPRVVGDVLGSAARLAYVAKPGEILLAESTRLLAGHALRLAPAREPNGRGRAWRLRELISDAHPIPLRLTTPFIGRDKELADLLRAYERTLAERAPRTIDIVGPAGIGKSRLAAEFRHRIGTDALILAGRCLSYGEGITLWPLAEIVEQAAGGRTPGALAARLAGEEEAWTIAERIAGALGAGGSVAGSEETFWAVRKFFEALARSRPVVVFLEDLHWAEPTFLELIDRVASSASGFPFLQVCLARPELFDRSPPRAGKANAMSMRLEPLSEHQSAALVEHLVDKELVGSAGRARIVGAAGGNPFFIEELVRVTVENKEGDAVSLRPPTIQAVLAARLDQLAVEERALLEAASVVGPDFWLTALAELVDDQARPRIADHLRTLVRKDLIRPRSNKVAGEESFSFRHLLIRDAAYDAVPKAQRARLHQQFGEWLERTASERLPEFEEIIGFHLEQSFHYRRELVATDEALGELAARAARHLAAAARRAHAREDAPAETNLLSRAVELLPPGDRRRVELLADLAEALRELGEFSRVRTLIDEAQGLASKINDAGLGAYVQVIRLLLVMKTDPDFSAEQVAREAQRIVTVLEERGVDRWLAKGWELRAWLPYLRCEAPEAEEALEKVVEYARRAGDRRQEGRALSLLFGTAVFGPLRVPEGIQRCKAVLRNRSQSRGIIASATRALASLKAMNGEFEEARALVARDKSLSEDLGRPVGAARASVAYGFLELLADDPVAAEVELRAGYDVLQEAGEQSSFSYVAALLAQALYLQGDDEEALRFADVAEQAAAPADLSAHVYWRVPRAKVLARRGRLEEAEELAEAAVALACKTDGLNIRGDSLIDAAEVLRFGGRPEEAATHVRRAIHAYDRKGNRAAARKARRMLAGLSGP